MADVLFTRQGALGRITLNRPAALNAMTASMIAAMATHLHESVADPEIRAIAIDGAGARGLCAGGDVRTLRELLITGEGAEPAVEFWASEYTLNEFIATTEFPIVAFMDGVVMGGGVGISTHATLRLVTDGTRCAMPETAIGFFPDVGALFPLSRAPGELGTYLAMTGATIGGADAIAVGLADALIEPAQWPQLGAQLAAGEPLPEQIGRSGAVGTLAAQRGWVDACFTGNDAAAILRRLAARPEPQAQQAAATLRARCPFSVALSLEAIRQAAHLPTVSDVLDQDRRIGANMMHGAPAQDFIEGVRAVLVDRDRAPRWRHTSLEEVNPDEVLAMFAERG